MVNLSMGDDKREKVGCTKKERRAAVRSAVCAAYDVVMKRKRYLDLQIPSCISESDESNARSAIDPRTRNKHQYVDLSVSFVCLL